MKLVRRYMNHSNEVEIMKTGHGTPEAPRASLSVQSQPWEPADGAEGDAHSHRCRSVFHAPKSSDSR